MADLTAALKTYESAKAAREAKEAELSKPVYPPGADPSRVVPAHGPTARRGENIMSSRGFEFVRLAGALSGKGNRENAKIEGMVAERLGKSLLKGGPLGEQGYMMAGGGSFSTTDARGRTASIPFGEGIMVPFGMDYLPQNVMDPQLMHEVKSLVYAGVENADPEQMSWLRQRHYGPEGKSGIGSATPQSYLGETLGGPLVAPPEYGELIQLLRNKEALINAGVRTIPLPPQGSVVFPRQTSATTGYYVGENAPLTPSNFGTGQLTLRAKKVAALTLLPNELIRFGGPAAEALLREDMSKTLALTMDYYLLSQGNGTDTTPLSIINTSGVVSITQTGNVAPSSNGKFFVQDIFQFAAQIQENNAEIEGYIMRPLSFWTLQQQRSATGGAPQSGLFVFNPGRDLNHKYNYVVGGLPCVLTPQVSNTQANTAGGTGVGTSTYIMAGMWSDYILGMFGAIEFAATAVSDVTFGSDQTAIRAILSHDGGCRHPGAFAVCSNITGFGA